MYQVTSAAKELEAPATTEKELFERLSVYTNSVIKMQNHDHNAWMDVVTTGVLISAQFRSSRDGYTDEDALLVRVGDESWIHLLLQSSVSVLLDRSWKVIHNGLPKIEDELPSLEDEEEELDYDDDELEYREPFEVGSREYLAIKEFVYDKI